jgi:hypothetical protein
MYGNANFKGSVRMYWFTFSGGQGAYGRVLERRCGDADQPVKKAVGWHCHRACGKSSGD